MADDLIQERVLILAPLTGDAVAMAELLGKHGFRADVCESAQQASQRLLEGAGALVLTDESLAGADAMELSVSLQSQAPWSEIPLLVLTVSGRASRYEVLIAWLAKAAGGITVLERPISTVTLLRSVEVALRSRRRQYQVKALLEAQQRTEASLRESEERWRLALDGAELGSWDVDLESGSAVWNRRHAGLMGHDLEKGPASLELWRDRVHPDDRPRIDAEFERARETKAPVAVEHRVVGVGQQDLGWIALYGRFYYDSRGRPVRMSGVSRSITEEKRAQASARIALQAQAQLAAIVNTSSDAIIGENLDGAVNSWNPSAERLYGYTADEILGTPVLRLIPPHLHSEHARALQRIGSGRSVAAHETVRLRKDGTPLHVSLSISPILDASGAVVGAAKIARDISQLVAARKAQEAMTEQLREADRRKNQFLATLSHELRNPLAPIRNAAQILSSPKLSAAQLKSSREIISRQADHMARLLGDLLDVARITYGKLTLQRSNLPLSSVLEAAIEAVQPLISAKGHELVIRLPEATVEIHGDGVRLTQIFSNLLTNAAKYTQPGGRIELQTRVIDGRVEVTVRDSGIGIAPEALSRVFELFAQSEEGLEHSQGGLGIGLSLTRALVKMHSGTISVESEVGAGSAFTVALPLAWTQTRSATPPTPDSIAPRRLLVVDDNRDAADSLAALLRMQGHTVAVAYDGEEGLRTASSYLPDCALLDLGMPGMDGHELAERIRAHPWASGTKLLALTGWGQKEVRQRTASVFDGHLVKPVTLEEIHAALTNGSSEEVAPSSRTH